MIRSAITGQALASKDLPTARALAGQRDVKDILLIRPPGQPDETCLMVSSTPLRDANNAITGALTVMTDMTHETMLQRQVKTYADQLERVYDTMACGVMVVSRNDLMTLMKKEPVLAVKLLWSFVQVISDRLRAANANLSEARQELAIAQAVAPFIEE